MNMDNFKKGEGSKDKSLGIKASDSDYFDPNNEQVAFLSKKIKFFKKGKGYDNKGASIKKLFNDRSQVGCYKCEKIDHIIKDCQL